MCNVLKMIPVLILVTLSYIIALSKAKEYYDPALNQTRFTLSGVAAYRSALTLDWMAAEDLRQRELAAAFETQSSIPSKVVSTDCIENPRPASGKVARLMLELLLHLEGDNSSIIPELIQSLVRAKLLVETSMLEAEPELETLLKTPGVMMGEPHTTFPRILAMTWMAITDPIATKKFGWCHIKKVSKYLARTKSTAIAKHMKALDFVIARARFIMEEFIQHVTPLNMYQKSTVVVSGPTKYAPRRSAFRRTPLAGYVRISSLSDFDVYINRTLEHQAVLTQTHMGEPLDKDQEPFPEVIRDGESMVIPQSSTDYVKLSKLLQFIVFRCIIL